MDASAPLRELGHEQEAMVLLRAVLESATNAAIVYDAAQDVYLANDKALELHGLPPAGSRFDDWVRYCEARRPDGSKVAPCDHPFAGALAGVRVASERLEIRPRIGAARRVDVRAEPLYDCAGGLIGAMAVFCDVESSESAEEALRMRSAITANMAEAVVLMRAADGRIVYANDTAERMLGYEAGELVGRDAATVTDGDPAPVAQALRREGEWHGELKSLRKDGTQVWCLVNVSAFDHPRHGEAWIAVATDITERRLAEAQMARENARLSGELESALAELQFSRARILATANLERRRIERDLHDGAQQRLVALRVRLGLAQELLREDPVRGAAMFGDLAADADAALDDIRLLARGVYPSVLVDRGLGDALRAAARSCPLHVTVDARRIARYPEDIETAVYFSCVEALQNAVKHTGGDTSVEIAVSQDDALRFDVVDTGGGFEVNGRPRGRGLANMRDRVESVGGTLAVESAPGRGTRVSGRIPTAPPHSR